MMRAGPFCDRAMASWALSLSRASACLVEAALRTLFSVFLTWLLLS